MSQAAKKGSCVTIKVSSINQLDCWCEVTGTLQIRTNPFNQTTSTRDVTGTLPYGSTWDDSWNTVRHTSVLDFRCTGRTPRSKPSGARAPTGDHSWNTVGH
uniref:(northern house mosquito) hypothetical protein n=1 Tax=Culex pipiens TaxID=7175 RepID=A0A8D8A2P4_CULPI